MQRFGAEMDEVEEAKCSVQGQARMCTQDGIWQDEHPSMDGACFPTEPEGGCSLLHQGGGQGVVRRGQRVGNGLSPLTRRLIPAWGTLMYEQHRCWLSGVRPRRRCVRERIMIGDL